MKKIEKRKPPPCARSRRPPRVKIAPLLVGLSAWLSDCFPPPF
nr:MAG TPA: hypothetical protein [Caudoviricetes sp.]